MLDAAGRCPGRKTEITKPLPVKAPNRLREQPSGMLLAETIEPDKAAVRPADRGPLLCGVPEVPRNQRSGSKAESWSRSCSSPHIRASRHSLLVSRTGGHISGRPGGLVDCCSEAVADRSGSDGQVAALATERQSRLTTSVWLLVSESGSLERRDSGPRDCCCFVKPGPSGLVLR
jgi:hypothetical protein